MHFLLFLSKWLRALLGRFQNRLAYGVLKPCYRCVYAKSYEPILIFSKFRGPRVIMMHKPSNYVYVRHKNCLGMNKCGKCFDAIEDSSMFPCEWVRL